jgi:hypothetical protein
LSNSYAVPPKYNPVIKSMVALISSVCAMC